MTSPQIHQGSTYRDQWGHLYITAYGGNWVCRHVDWATDDGIALLPVPIDAAIIIESVAVPANLDTLDQARLAAAVQQMIAAVRNQTTMTLDTGSLHECYRAERSAIYMMRLRPRI